MTDLRRLLADLQGFSIGVLPQFAAGLAAPDDARQGVGAARLLDDGALAAIIERFDREFGRTDPRAILSNWASYYFKTALPPLLVANIVFDRVPRADLDQVGFVIGPDLRVLAIKLGREVARLEQADVRGRFDSLIATHLAPLIELMARRSGVTERVLWSNAATVMDTSLGMIGSAAADRPGFAQARALLASRTLHGGRRNPLHAPVRVVEGKRVRRVCCMLFLAADGRVCAICPLKANSPARRVPAGSRPQQSASAATPTDGSPPVRAAASASRLVI